MAALATDMTCAESRTPVSADKMTFGFITLTHIVIQKSQRRSEEHGRLRKEVLGCQTRLGLLLALGFREHEDDECRTTCAFTPFSRDRRLNDLSAVCF